MRPKIDGSRGDRGPSSITVHSIADQAAGTPPTDSIVVDEKRNNKDIQGILENDLMCPICQDILINPLILNCTHTFCKFCVYRWLSSKTCCPQCRMDVSFQAENLALRNVINRMVLMLPLQYQKNRKQIIEQRLKDEETLSKNCPLVVLNKDSPAGRFRVMSLFQWNSDASNQTNNQSGYLARRSHSSIATDSDVVIESANIATNGDRPAHGIHIELHPLGYSQGPVGGLARNGGNTSSSDEGGWSPWDESDHGDVDVNSEDDMDYEANLDEEEDDEDSDMDSEEEVYEDDRFSVTSSSTTSIVVSASSSDTEPLDTDDVSTNRHPMETRNNTTIELASDDDDTSDDDYEVEEDDEDIEEEEEGVDENDDEPDKDSSSASVYSSSETDIDDCIWIDSEDELHSSASSPSSTETDPYYD